MKVPNGDVFGELEYLREKGRLLRERNEELKKNEIAKNIKDFKKGLKTSQLKIAPFDRRSGVLSPNDIPDKNKSEVS